MQSKKRKYISVYFRNGNIGDRNKRDVTISFDDKDPLYEKCGRLGSSGIKMIIGIDSYQELTKKASDEDRAIGNFIKFRLKKYFSKR